MPEGVATVVAVMMLSIIQFCRTHRRSLDIRQTGQEKNHLHIDGGHNRSYSPVYCCAELSCSGFGCRDRILLRRLPGHLPRAHFRLFRHEKRRRELRDRADRFWRSSHIHAFNGEMGELWKQLYHVFYYRRGPGRHCHDRSHIYQKTKTNSIDFKC